MENHYCYEVRLQLALAFSGEKSIDQIANAPKIKTFPQGWFQHPIKNPQKTKSPFKAAITELGTEAGAEVGTARVSC